jgi:phage gp29-like protein
MAERGLPVRQFDCWDDQRKRHGHLRALIEQRTQSIAGCEMIIRPGRDDTPSRIAAEALFDRIAANTNASDTIMRGDVGVRHEGDLVSLVEHHMMAVHDGIALSNTVWDWVDGYVSPIEFVHGAPRRFRAPHERDAARIMLIVNEAGTELVPLEWGLWCVSRMRNRNPFAGGLGVPEGFMSMFVGWSIRDWQVFAEMFGVPFVVGSYKEGAALESRRKLEEACQRIGTDAYAVISDFCSIIITQARSGDSTTVYPAITRWCEDTLSKLILGATLTTDAGGPGSKGSYALGAVHESRAYALARGDARRIQAMFRRDIGAPFCAWNGLDRAAPPDLKIQIARDSLERAKVLEIIGQLVPIDEDQVYEDFTLRRPKDGKGVKFSPKAGPKEERDAA